MADLVQCLRLQDFSAEDAAEIRGFIRAAGSDVAGVEAYIASLQQDMDGLKADLVERMGLGSEYNQSGRLMTDTLAFKAWFGDSKVVDAAGNPLVVYHGTRKGGFGVFSTEGGTGKTAGTGAFFTQSNLGASTYSGTKAEIIPLDVAEIVANPSKYGFSVEERRGEWIATDPNGNDWASDDREQALAEIASDYVSSGFAQEGNYAVYLSIKNPKVIDAGGQNWGSIGGKEWFVEDENGDGLEYFTSKELLDDFLSNYEGDVDSLKIIESNDNPDAASTDDLVREARDEGYDGVIFENITDEGPFGQGYGWDDKVYVAFAPTQIKSVYNRGTFDANDPRILYQAGKPAWMQEILDRASERKALAAELAANGGSVRLSREDGQTAVAGPDMSKPGGFRLTRFDNNGPVGHVEYDSLEAAVDAGLRDRFSPARREMFQFAGPQSRTADIHAMASARDMLESGRNPETVRRETGWFKGADGQWRYEISDADAKFKKGVVPKLGPDSDADNYMYLSDMLDHDKLFAAYPAFKHVNVIFDANMDANGSVGGGGSWIRLNPRKLEDTDALMSTLLHEVQHLIQFREGFAMGGNLQITERVKDGVRRLMKVRDNEVENWIYRNKDKLEDVKAKQALSGYVQMFKSFDALIKYSNSPAPSGVFRLIRSEAGWLYSDIIQRSGNEELAKRARDLDRSMWELPKPHKMAARNRFLSDYAFALAQIIRDAVPADIWQSFKDDPRQLNSMVKAYEREAAKSRAAVRPLDAIRDRARVARDLESGLKYKGPFEIYQALAGEVESRNTQTRAKMTDADRRMSSPRETQDVPEGSVIVLFRDGEIETPFIANMDEDRTLYQGQGTKRGSIVLPSGGMMNGRTVINLFEQADLSTFLHESGHFFLEAFTALATSPDAPQGMKDDLAAIHKFLGVDGSKPLQTEQHETWARGFEAYLLEGKAPSLELADAFARFKAWLTRIYRSIAGLNVKLTPEIREVMDRMLATDAQITAAREAQNMSPLFADQAAAGMSEGAWNTYQRMARRSAEEASQALLEKTMAKVKREREAWWRAERKQVRTEVTATFNSQREYRLIEMLANQRWIGSDKEIPDMQISRKELVDAFGPGILNELSRAKLGGKRAIYGDNGASLREVADFFGFNNPSEMVEVLQNTGKRQDAIERETDRIMSDRYGDPLNDGSIEEEAVAAIHSEQQAMTVASEVRHLASRAGLPTRNLTAKVFRQRAKLMLGRMAVREATRPDAFLAAERKASKRAEDAFARVASGRDPKEALTAAARHKEQQLLNHYLYQESRDLAKMVEAKREKMRAYNKASVRAKLDGGYIEQIDALLEAYDFRVRSQRQIQRAESLKQFVDRMTAEGRAGELNIDERLIDQAKKVHYSRLSVDELQGLFDTIDNIDHLGRFKKKLQDAQDARDMDEVVSAILGEFNANVSGNPPSRTGSKAEDRRKIGRDYLNTVLNADTLLREIDGFKDLGPTWTALKAKIDNGMYRLVDRRRNMAESFDAIYGVYSAKEQREMAVKRHNPHLGDVFSKFDLLALALNTGNEVNFERLTNPKTPGGYPRNAVEAALAELDERDWQTVQNIWDYIDSFWPEIAAKEKRQTGTVPKKVEAKQIVPAPGFVTGGYYPIKYDSRLSGLADDFQQKDLAEELMGGMFGKAQTRNGHTKARTTTTRQPVLLDLSVAHSHVEQVIYDLEIGEAVNASWKILHDPRVRSMFTEKGKKSDFDALEIWLQDVAAGERTAAGGLQTIMRHIRSGFTISRLAFNISTALIQPSGIVQSAVVIGKKEVAKGYIDYMSNRARWVKEVTEVSPMMRERKTTFERDIFNVVGALEDGPVTGRWAKFQRDVVLPMSFWMMQAVQFHTVDMPTWVAAYQKEVGLSGDEAKARAYADAMVKRAQGSGFNSDLGMLQRGTLNKQSRQQEFPRLLTALGSYMFAKGNVFYERVQQTDFKSPVQILSLAIDTVLLFTLEATLYAAVKGGFPGDEEDDQGWLEWLAQQTMFGFMSTMPVAREFAGALQGFGGGGVFGAALDTLSRPFTQAYQGELDKALVKSFVDAGGVLFHLPSSQLKAFVDAIAEGEPKRALGFGTAPGRTIADLMFGE